MPIPVPVQALPVIAAALRALFATPGRKITRGDCDAVAGHAAALDAHAAQISDAATGGAENAWLRSELDTARDLNARMQARIAFLESEAAAPPPHSEPASVWPLTPPGAPVIDYARDAGALLPLYVWGTDSADSMIALRPDRGPQAKTEPKAAAQIARGARLRLWQGSKLPAAVTFTAGGTSQLIEAREWSQLQTSDGATLWGALFATALPVPAGEALTATISGGLGTAAIAVRTES
jgi:hypothetical protein